jgi:hypothetical protein
MACKVGTQLRHFRRKLNQNGRLPALGECLHCSLARRSVAIYGASILVVPERLMSTSMPPRSMRTSLDSRKRMSDGTLVTWIVADSQAWLSILPGGRCSAGCQPPLCPLWVIRDQGHRPGCPLRSESGQVGRHRAKSASCHKQTFGQIQPVTN